ncbi:myb-related transcription factor, partner of profilin-like [Rhinichthys klamathensis goyatoka]|uniref:myb-related transcription factor, partner of profilin-like n=1 Tax=Rhinichthys klamathensis goyatoka TaxID=3034132 RepID=UPI0024B60BB4|nr:myb-related transcription factor, partner of profilin-like [Rhinichthys klamathensis goyatoka]
MAEQKTTSKDTFQKDEINVLLEEIEQNKDVIFTRFKGHHTNKEKQNIWEDIATKLTATRGVQRSGKEVRKKWQDFASLAKRKRALQRTAIKKTGGGTNESPLLTAEEEKALSILGTSASDGISGGIDIHGGVGIPQPDPESGPSCSGEPSVSSAISEHLPSPSPPNNPRMPQPPSSVVQTAATTPQQFENVCSCSRDLVQLEGEKLDVLKDIRQCLQEANERDNNFQQQLIELKKAKLSLAERRVALEEMSFARPSISVPIILPEDTVQMRVPLLNREEDEEVEEEEEEEEDVEDEDGMGPHGQPRNAQYMAGFRARQREL